MLKIRIEIVMLVFFNVIRIVMVEYVPSKQSVNQQLCIQILTKLQSRIKKKKKDKRQNLWRRGWLLQQGKSLEHEALRSVSF